MRKVARLLVLAGAIGVGWLLSGARAREVVLVYDVSAARGATSVEVELRSGGEVVRHARLAVGAAAQVRHPMRLRDGSYELAWRVEAPSGTTSGARTVAVDGDQTVVLPLSP